MNKKKMISASIMCADLLNLTHDIKILEDAKIDFLHLDIMDGKFVPNITLGIDLCNKIGEISNIKRDFHLLLNDPTIFIDRFNLKEDEMVTVHFEADVNINLLSYNVRSKGAKFGVALNPETPITVLDDYLDDIDYIVLMMIKPGFAGMKKEDGMIEKIMALRTYLNKKNKGDLLIEVDGNVSFQNATIMSSATANIFVAGTSSIFSKKYEITKAIEMLRNNITSNK